MQIKKPLTRNQKIKLLNHVIENGYNELIFKEPIYRVFFQDLNNKGYYQSGDESYSEKEVFKINHEINEINKYLNDNKIHIYEKQHLVVIVNFIEGKTIL